MDPYLLSATGRASIESTTASTTGQVMYDRTSHIENVTPKAPNIIAITIRKRLNALETSGLTGKFSPLKV
jgi:hypothetical protein